MASEKVAVFSYSVAFLLIFLVFPFRVSCYLYEGGAKVSISADSQKVNLTVYYETLSLPSAKFIVQNLGTIFDNGLSNIINLRMVPWGIAHVNKANYTVVCQHGPDECQLNAIQACAINVLNDVNKIYGLSYCIEFLVIEGRYQHWNTCFDQLGLPLKPVSACYKSGNRKKLEISHGYETGRLSPPLGFVPWVVVNNVPILKDYENFATYVCNEFKGSPIPNACKASVTKISSTAPVRFKRVSNGRIPFSGMPTSSKIFYNDPSKGFK